MKRKEYKFTSFRNWYKIYIKNKKNDIKCFFSRYYRQCYNAFGKKKFMKGMLSVAEDRYTERIDRILEETDLNSIPVPITSIAKYYKFKVLEMPLDENCSGLIMVDDANGIKNLNTNRVIIVNSNDSNNRKRFTVAHELGHYFLENDGQTCFGHRDIGDYSPREREANTFASEILMPKNRLTKFVDELKKSVWGNLPSSLLVSMISSNFNVSESAAEVRLSKLGLIGD